MLAERRVTRPTPTLPYNRLELADGGIFFIFLAVGPFWGLFFYNYHPLLLNPLTGLFMLLSALTLMSFAEARQYQRTGSTIIPAHWWSTFYGSILILYLLSINKNFLGIVLLAGLIVIVSVLLVWNKGKS